MLRYAQILVLALALGPIQMAFGQVSPVYFKSGKVQTVRFNGSFEHDFSSSELINGGYYRLITFDKIPTSHEKESLKSIGIELLGYMPKNAFYAFISANSQINSLSKFGANGIHVIEPIHKQSEELVKNDYPDWAFDGTYLELNGHYYENVEATEAQMELSKIGATIISANSNFIHFIINVNALNNLLANNRFYYFETIPSPEVPDNLDGRTNHRSNMLANDYSTGIHYDGTGVTVMMQDDGYIGDHIDYQGRIDQSNCFSCTWDDGNNHGDHVAGTIMGAGNLDPRARGMAFGADLLVFNSSNANYDNIPSYYANDQVIITSKSYSSTCNGGYDSRAQQLDEQMYDLPGLIHVFSAGNNGAGDCGYGAGAGWGNITGGHKSGKNVIAVGNLNSTDGLNGSSSRGPATDGRIKPDICGVGTNVVSTISDYTYASFTGTSMSCPGVAGTLAQLYQAYKEANGGNNPPSGLIKGAILNTAEDLGNPGPDFKYGWGRINAIKAHTLIEQGNYIVESVSQGATNNHPLAVPNGVKQLKVMVYWNDFKGSTSASMALVNDINMTLVDPSAGNHLPFVLDPTPNATALNSVAVPGVDNLNNMEQVVLDDPAAGNYNVSINGFAIPQGPQEYFVVYEFIFDEITVTYPVGGEGLVPGGSEKIRWDAAPISGDFTVEYTADNGATWNSVGTANSSARYINWSPPNIVSGEVRVRVTRGLQSDESDANFTIMQVPQNIQFAWSCPDSLNITWNAVPGATSYDVYMLGTKYMDSIGSSTTTSFTAQVPATLDNWFSVRAFGPNGARSERAIAVRKLPGEFGCTWSAPHAAIELSCDSVSSMSCVDIMNASVNTTPSSSYTWYFPTGTPSTSTLENPTVCFSSPGFHDAALVVDNGAGTDSIYINDLVFVQTAMGLPYHEGFENISTFTGSDFWIVNNSSGSAFFVTNTAALSGTNSVRLNNFGQQAGTIDELISGPVDLSSLNTSDVMTLSFRYAHVKRDANSDDWLRLFVKGACDGNWLVRKTLHGNFLSTDINSSPWVPSSSSDWTTVHVTNITSQYFTGDFRFMFQFEHGGGNNFFLDDINIYQGAPMDTVVSGIAENNIDPNIHVYPNPTEKDVNVEFSLSSAGTVLVELMDVNGRKIQTQIVNASPGKNLLFMDVKSVQSGVYFINVSFDNYSFMKKIIVN